MGVLHDYFRAPDGAAAARVPPRFDGIDAKGVIIRQVPWDVDLIRCTRVWPDGPAPDADDYLDLATPWPMRTTARQRDC